MCEPDVIFDVLSKLQEDDVFALARTITQGLLKVNTKDDALKAIVKYSPDVLSILRRKLITREVLFAYLDEKNIKIRLPATKNDLIDKVIEYWDLSARPSSNKELTPQPQEGNLEALAKQFTSWFFSMLNNEGVGSEHFYSDAKLKINFISDSDRDTTLVENDPEEISRALTKVRTQHDLVFNPNVSQEGVQGRMNPHGLVMISVCGTLHVRDVCAGVFEQIFALARDPHCDNNWKVKSSEVNLRSKMDQVGLPRLCDGELTRRALAIEEGDSCSQ